MQPVLSTNVRTSTTREVATQTSAEELDAIVGRATEASSSLASMSRVDRAHLLRRIAEELQTRGEEIVRIADEETAIGAVRLEGELARTTGQFRAFASVLDDGGFLEATIDHARPDATPPRPDLRRMLVPLGPVAVFGASNFPLAFSVPGGDTASALAAGCAVVAKVHESHPATSIVCHEAIEAACVDLGAPRDSVQLLFGRASGVELVKHPGVRAGAFTGSLAGGRALLDAISARPDPIPFYAELASINPVLVTAGAAAARGHALGAQIGQSLVTLGGQICTKPGLVLVPAGEEGDAVVEGIREVVAGFAPVVALNSHIAASYRARHQRTSEAAGVVAVGDGPDGTETELSAHVLSIDLELVGDETVQENFGPAQLVARYRDLEDLSAALTRLAPSLTATVQAEDDELDDPRLGALVRRLEQLSGRLIFNGVPTGVAVSWAQHHGGPWPATNSLHTSVGATAVRRFLRPYAWQDAPAAWLPEELREETSGLPRRVNGVLRT